MRTVQTSFGRLIELVPYLPQELQIAVANIDDPAVLSYLVASSVRMQTEDKQQLLAEVDVAGRLRELVRLLGRELEVVELGSKIQSQVASEVEKTQREYLLRQQLRAIQEELGEADPEQAEARGAAQENRRSKPARARAHALRTANSRGWRGYRRPRPSTASSARTSSGSSTCRGRRSRADNLDLEQARAVLDEDHFDLDKVKERILEFLAVPSCKQRRLTGPILCFVGPPGVGKTSLGQSIARALGRKFVRISLGGVRDEAEIRGHRRTYIGAMPGRIIQALKRARVKQPGLHARRDRQARADFRGDPVGALLEVLDPEQNDEFRDHYLDVPFDLSKVLFVCTANTLGRRSPRRCSIAWR